MTVELAAITDPDVAVVAAFLHANLNARVPASVWRRAMSVPWKVEAPNHGFMLRDGQRVVGVYLAFYSERVVAGRAERFCNLGAWCVLPDFRFQSVRLLKALLAQEGYLPDQFFNGLHGATRLYYAAPDQRWSIDVVIDELVMSHKLDLRRRLDGAGTTLPLADLLLSKLQVWEINRKDLGDALCLLADHPVAGDEVDPEAISLPRIQEVLGADWGFCHTTERNLGKLAELWTESRLLGASCDVAEQVGRIQGAIEAAPKTVGWRMRSRVGERVRWYETPEEVGH